MLSDAAEDRRVKRVVYTALVGGYERLNEQPMARGSDVEFICFTDDPDLVSETWDIRLVQPRFSMDTVRSARYFKIMGTSLLQDYDESLWIDNSVQLRVDPGQLLDDLLSGVDFALPVHSYRTSVLGEFEAVVAAGYDEPARVYEQLFHYSSADESVLRQRPFWTAILARRHTTPVLEAMDMWFDHVLRYSRRDQLSINAVLAWAALPHRAVDIDNNGSSWHAWPVHAERKWGIATAGFAQVLRTPAAEIGRLQNELQDVRARADEEIARAQQERDAVQSDITRTVADFQSSFSWRVTRPLRWLRDRVR